MEREAIGEVMLAVLSSKGQGKRTATITNQRKPQRAIGPWSN
jgi:hypothetical protein